MFYVIAIIALLLIIALILYNTLIRKKNDVENAFASIDVMLRKRYDLIPAIVEAVKGYMKHERVLLTEITSLRIQALSDHLNDDDRVIIENKIRKGLADLFVAVEDYPDLKASRNFLQLQASLNEVEEQLAASRRAFNAAVTTYNNSVEAFPSNIIASMMNYSRRTLFEIPESERENVSAKELIDRQ
ncbi:MAG: LemA family protein [Bacteroidales bacterium]|nr:LemA family protein [Bacteroidales bacterium]